jgi:Na+-driven multidrug efflux pump
MFADTRISRRPARRAVEAWRVLRDAIRGVVFWALQLPLAWLLSHHTSLGPSGVFVTLAVCFSVFAAIGVALFRRGGWKLTRV